MDMSVFLSAPLQLDRICRACLSEKGDMKPLYGACLDEMLASFAQIQVKQGDGLPAKMCVQCILQCSRAYSFKQLCEKTENILRNFVSAEFQAQLCDALQQPKAEPLDESIDNITESAVESVDDANTKDAIIEDDLQDYSNTVTNVVMEDGLPAQIVTFADGTTGYYMENVTIMQDDDALHDVSILANADEGTVFSEEENFITTTATTSELPPESDIPGAASSADRPKTFTCPKCDEVFNRKVDLKVHMMSHPKELQHKCSVCKKAFAEARILKRHAKTHLAKKPHKCDQCDMTFAESSNLSKHKKKHTGELRNMKGKPHLCSVCGRAFKWASSLSKHMKYHTGHKLHVCEFEHCGKQYVEARSLMIHMRSHTGERPHVCPVCDKTFTQYCNLEKHLRIHTGQKPYACKICGKGFAQGGYVAIHMRTHTGEKPYVCQTCGKAFTSSNTLAVHQRVHTGTKPFECGICGKRFSRLKVHQVIHGLLRMVPCKECGMSYGSDEQLQEHLIAAHSILDTGVKTVEITDLL